MSILEKLRYSLKTFENYLEDNIMKKIIALALVAALSLALVACSSTTEEETTEETTTTTTEETTTEETTEETADEETTEETEGEAVANLPVVTNEGNVYTVVYTEENADAQAFLTEMTVVVELGDAGELVSVTVDNVVEGSTGLYPAAEGAQTSIPEAMVAANSAEVDAVAGATFTSNAILAAVEAALATATAAE